MSNFNIDGPIKVSDKEFVAFRTLTDGKTFNEFFYLWIDENYTEGVRVLCLRNMLRQTATNYETHAFRQTDAEFSQLLNVDKRFFWQLKNRPVLLAELTSEFLYVLRGNLIAPYQDSQHAKDQLIELMIPFLHEPDGRNLAAYHSLWQKSTHESEDVGALLTHWGNLYRVTWLRDELWQSISSVLDKEIEIYQDELAMSCNAARLASITSVPPVALLSVFRFVNGYATKALKPLTPLSKPQKSTAPLAQLIGFLEQNLPPYFCYSSVAETVRIAMALEEVDVAYSYIRRHLIGSDRPFDLNTEGTRDWVNFLLWAYGLTSYYSCGDDELRDALEKHLQALPAPKSA